MFLGHCVNTVKFGMQGQNKLVGKLPSIGGMTSLMALRIPDNQLTGRQRAANRQYRIKGMLLQQKCCIEHLLCVL